MSIVSCPRCGDKVSVPPQAPPTALVQCPLCSEEYYLSDALIQLPPALIVVSGGAPAAGAEEYRLEGAAPAGVTSEVFGVTGGETAVAARPQLRTVSRPRRAEKSVVGEIVKVVLGGAAGLAGAMLVLWWGFGRDIGDLGPTVSRIQYLRFLVPPKFRDDSVSTVNQVAPLDTIDAESQGNGAAPKKGKNKRNASGDATDGDTAKAAAAEKKRADSEQDQLKLLDSLEAPTTTKSDPLELKIDGPLSVTSPKTSKSKEPNDDPTSAPPDGSTSPPERKKKDDLQQPDRATPEELEAAIEAANAAAVAAGEVARDDEEAFRRATSVLYARLAAIGRLAERLDLEEADLAEQVAAVKARLHAIAANPTLMESLAPLAEQTIKEGSGTAGIVLAGTVKDFKSAGDVFETTVEFGKEGESIAVLTAGNPQDFCKVDDKIVVLGSLLRSPAESVAGYKGDADVAVKAAQAVAVLPKLPDEAPPESSKPQDAKPSAEEKPSDSAAKPARDSPPE